MPSAEPTSHFFAYGTLRRDAPMHALLGESARFVAAATFRGRLWDCGAYPGVTDSNRNGDVVHGELYRLPDHDREGLLDRLDRYEGEGFERAERKVTTDAGETLVAFVFLFRGSTRGARRVASGDYVADLKTRDPAARLG